MRVLTFVCAVAALAATAFARPAQAYCRGCVIEPQRADLAAIARAEAPPIAIKATCHVEKHRHVVNGRARWRRVEVCE